MHNLKFQVKRSVSSILTLIGRLYPKDRIPVLLYHSVDTSGSDISITPREFKAQMEYLKFSEYRTISLMEYMHYLQTDGKSHPKEVVLTFDDGFKNNYSEVFPVLREYGFTATIFLATNYIDGICTWEKNEFIPNLQLLSWGEIEEMSAFSIDFASHSSSHPYLTKLSEAKIRIELLNSKSIIEAKLKKPVTFFSHPYGDTNKQIQRMAEECGYLGAFSSIDFGLANNKDNLYDLKRVGTAHFSSLQDFKAALLGTYDCYIKLKRLFSRL